MAEVVAAAHKEIGPVFGNEVGYIKLTYNFADDAGASANHVTLGTTKGKILITKSLVFVETAATSGASATVAIGLTGGDVDAFLDTTSGAVANLTDDAVLQETTGQDLVVAADTKIQFDIGTADLTAGKVHLILQYVSVA